MVENKENPIQPSPARPLGTALVTKVAIGAALVVVVGATLYLKSQRQNPGSKALSAPTTTTLAAQPAAPHSANSSPKAALPRLVDLGAGKCIPCKMMKPILDQLQQEYADRFEVIVLDVWENPDAGRQYNIRVIPTQIFYDASGKELFRHEGFYSKEDILKKWNEFGFSFQKEK